MKTKLLRLARRSADGCRSWTVPGAPHAFLLIPADRSQFGAPAASWPAKDAQGDWIKRGARLDWHRAIVKREVLALIKAAKKLKPGAK